MVHLYKFITQAQLGVLPIQSYELVYTSSGPAIFTNEEKFMLIIYQVLYPKDLCLIILYSF